MTILFISDLHLQEERPELTRAFLDFLATRARKASALYILGDFFEAWIGDDDDSALAQTITQALTDLVTQGTAVFFQHGNRDFLVGERFAETTGATLLAETHLIDLGEHTALLMHGDSLCTRDEEYQRFRHLVRNPAWQQELLGKPLEERRQIAQQLRTGSQAANQDKQAEIMDVTPAEVERVMRKHAAQVLIHGHTHRPAIHDMLLDGKPAQRIVLGDWGDNYGWVLEWRRETGFDLQRFPIETPGS